MFKDVGGPKHVMELFIFPGLGNKVFITDIVMFKTIRLGMKYDGISIWFHSMSREITTNAAVFFLESNPLKPT